MHSPSFSRIQWLYIHLLVRFAGSVVEVIVFAAKTSKLGLLSSASTFNAPMTIVKLNAKKTMFCGPNL